MKVIIHLYPLMKSVSQADVSCNTDSCKLQVIKLQEYCARSTEKWLKSRNDHKIAKT